MHDGVGGQLVALIVQLNEDNASEAPIRAALRATLDDLRLVIDSLDDACADLSVALAMLRQRLASLPKSLVIGDNEVGLPQLIWDTAHLPDLPAAPPAHVLAVLRIVQEALTNALKHAQAHTIRISAHWQAPDLRIVVADDGIGINPAQPAGRGLLSMQQRALEIGAVLEFCAQHPQGTQVSLTLGLR
jgi:signal transduction histidine kinase